MSSGQSGGESKGGSKGKHSRSPAKTGHGTDQGADHDESGAGAAREVARLHVWQVQAVRDALVILAVLTLIWIGYAMRDVTVPLLIALALAYLFEPLVQRLCRVRGMSRPLAVTIILLIVGGVVTIALAFAVPLAIGQTVSLIHRVRSSASDFPTMAAQVISYAPEQYRDDLQQAVQWIEHQFESEPSPSSSSEATTAGGSGSTSADETEEVTTAAKPAESDEAPSQGGTDGAPPPVGQAVDSASQPAVQSGVQEEMIRALVRDELSRTGVVLSGADRERGLSWRILGALGTTAETVIDFMLAIIKFSLLAFLIPFYFWFFSVHFPRVVDFVGSLIPEGNRSRAHELIGDMDRAVSGFVRGRIVVCAMMGVLFAIGWLFCGVPYAITLGLLAGALSIVPYLGAIGLPLAVGALLLEQMHLPDGERMAWWALLLWPTVVFVVVQVIEGYILTPIMMGKATDLDPVTIVVAILAGGAVAGVYGMILAIPAAACGKILLLKVVLPKVRAWSRGERPDPLPLQGLDEPRSQG